MEYELTSLCSTPQCLRATTTPSGVALPRRLHGAPLPGPLGQRQRLTAVPDRPQPRLLPGDRPQRHPGLPRGRRRLPPREIVPAPLRPAGPGRSPSRRVEGSAAPQPTPARQSDRPLDPGPPGRGLPRTRLDSPAVHRRGHPAHAQTVRHSLAACQAHWITSPDPGYARKKKRGTG